MGCALNFLLHSEYLGGLQSYADQLLRAPPPQGQGFEHFSIQKRAAYTEGDGLNQAFEVFCLCCQKNFISGGTPRSTIHATASLANFKTHVKTQGHQKRQQNCKRCSTVAAPVPPPPSPAAPTDPAAAAAAGKC